jgi:hypothetical protein
MSRTNLSAVVSRQLPEHIREDYPTFVAFVEAYYEYLQAQGVDFTTIRDIDRTLESFVDEFRKELAYNLPNITQNERFLLQNVKDQYLAKGSEGSYKLLFKLLFGKEVELIYPGRSMLRASDGRWNQEISLFAKVDYGIAENVVGKLVDIQTPTRILRVLIDRRQDIIGEVDRIVLIDPNQQVYEFFLDKRFFGVVSAGDRIRFRDEFQATILPATQTLNITQPGKNFRIGQVFELRSGNGTGALMKVTAVTDAGGIKYAEIIKFGIGYTADFAVSLLANNSITSVGTGATTSSSTLVQQTTYVSTALGSVTVDPTPITAGSFVVGQKYQVTSLGSTDWISIGAGWESSADLKQGVTYTIRSVGTTNWVSLGAASNTSGVTFTANANGAAGTGYATAQGFSVIANNPAAGIDTVGTKFVARGIGSGTGTAKSLSVVGSATNFGAVGNIQVGDEMWVEDGDLLIGVVESITNSTNLTLESLYTEYTPGTVVNTSYSGVYTFRNPRSVGSLYAPGGTQSYTLQSSLTDRTLGFDEQGYVNLGDFVTHEYVDGTYAGSIIREFSLNFRNAQSDAADPAIVEIDLGALVKYPGYFETNNGFLDDSIYIQDSKYYQAFSYVLKIDERLASYSSAVKTMLHPAGMALFGEFNITNNYDLSIALESLVKSLGIGLEDTQSVVDSGITSINTGKALSDSIDTPNDSDIRKAISKALDTSLEEPTDSLTQLVSKALSTSYSGIEDATTLSTDKALSTSYSGLQDIAALSTGKALANSQSIADALVLTTDKYVDEDTLDPQTEEGYVGLNPYAGQDFFAAEYSVGSRESTFTTP